MKGGGERSFLLCRWQTQRVSILPVLYLYILGLGVQEQHQTASKWHNSYLNLKAYDKEHVKQETSTQANCHSHSLFYVPKRLTDLLMCPARAPGIVWEPNRQQVCTTPHKVWAHVPVMDCLGMQNWMQDVSMQVPGLSVCPSGVSNCPCPQPSPCLKHTHMHAHTHTQITSCVCDSIHKFRELHDKKW